MRAALALVAVAAAARPVAAHPQRPPDDRWRAPPPPPPPPVDIATASPAPTPAPAPPRWQSFGFRTGVQRLSVVGHDRLAFDYGLEWGVALVGRVHGFAEYDLLLESEPSPADGDPAHGRGHALTTGVRFPVLTTLLGRADDVSGTRLRPHVDLELGGAAMLVSDDQLGSHALAQALIGARLGLEMVRTSDAGGLRPGTADIHFTWRATTTGDGVTWAFALGMDWGG
ncbi:MAG: hypothetical protein IPL61_08455 [Myxococcales bacterium]|nr:hypothetical protein [Myxococcales bacterium]